MPPSDSTKRRPNTAVYSVFDGHSGVDAAEYVSAHLVDKLMEDELFWSSSSADVIRSLETKFQQVDDDYLAMCDAHNCHLSGPYDPQWMCAGTTAVVCIVRGGQLWYVYCLLFWWYCCVLCVFRKCSHDFLIFS
jgi:serine/threonine protein phosphatase PrpC